MSNYKKCPNCSYALYQHYSRYNGYYCEKCGHRETQDEKDASWRETKLERLGLATYMRATQETITKQQNEIELLKKKIEKIENRLERLTPYADFIVFNKTRKKI